MNGQTYRRRASSSSTKTSFAFDLIWISNGGFRFCKRGSESSIVVEYASPSRLHRQLILANDDQLKTYDLRTRPRAWFMIASISDRLPFSNRCSYAWIKSACPEESPIQLTLLNASNACFHQHLPRPQRTGHSPHPHARAWTCPDGLTGFSYDSDAWCLLLMLYTICLKRRTGCRVSFWMSSFSLYSNLLELESLHDSLHLYCKLELRSIVQ